MKVIDGKKVAYASEEEFCQHQLRASKPHDKDRLVRARIAEALRFLMFGGTLSHTAPPVFRADPRFAEDVSFLDVGCRDGWSLTCLNRGWDIGRIPGFFRFQRRFGNAMGIELSAQTVEYARARRRNVVQADIRRCVLSENTFDIIFSRHCLEHLDDPLQATENIARMLKPGGTILAIVPQERKELNPEKSLHSHLFGHDNDLADVLSRAGLQITASFCRHAYWMKKRKYYHRFRAKRRLIGPELWVLGTKV